MRTPAGILFTALFGLFVLFASASPVKAGQEVPEVSPDGAWELYQETGDAVILDVRTAAEYHLVGHPEGAELVPLLYWNEMERTTERNPDFLEQVEARFEKSRTLLVICRSGNRSRRAAEMLSESGFEKLYHIDEGFEGERDENGKRTVNGWKNAGLPWEY